MKRLSPFFVSHVEQQFYESTSDSYQGIADITIKCVASERASVKPKQCGKTLPEYIRR